MERFHLVGAKIGGTIARAFAARRPTRVRTLTVVGTPPPYRVGAAERAPALMQAFEQPGGVARWAQESMGSRLGSTFPPEGVTWWTHFMGRTAASTRCPPLFSRGRIEQVRPRSETAVSESAWDPHRSPKSTAKPVLPENPFLKL